MGKLIVLISIDRFGPFGTDAILVLLIVINVFDVHGRRLGSIERGPGGNYMYQYLLTGLL